MARIEPFVATVPVLEKISQPNDFFRDVKTEFRKFVKKGFYKTDAHEAFWIHRVQTKYRSYTGIVVYIHIEEYLSGAIRRHEHTIRAKEDKVQEIYEERQGLIKPVLLTYPNVMDIDALTNRLTFSLKPAYEFDFNDEHHTYWRIDQPVYVEHYKLAFRNKLPFTYIADGHHRSHTSAELYKRMKTENPTHHGNEPYNYLLAELFPVSEIEIHNYNRILTSLNGVDHETFLSRLEAFFELETSKTSFKPTLPHQIGMYFDKTWYHLTVKPQYLVKLDGIVDRLDVQIFNETVLRQALGIHDVRTYSGIEYMEGPRGTHELVGVVDNGDAIASFNLHPLALEDMVRIADQGGVLPPKSTWFFPRLRNGFIAQLFK
jgi:uncharacterized protein (DUF1015 family)